jgi:ABC-type Fe3+ transport system substrate-binding protein
MSKHIVEQQVPAPFKMCKVPFRLCSFGKRSNSLFISEILGTRIQEVAIIIFLMAPLSVCTLASAATSGSALQKAKHEAEAKGYTFITSHDEIIAQAKKEGRLRVLAEMEPPTIKATTKAFMQKYPFINLEVQEISGTSAVQANILEIKSGAGKDWDILHLSQDFYNEFIPYLWKIDLLGMAGQGVLQIPTPMIDPRHRNVAAFYTRFQVAVYNKNMFTAQQLPKFWEDILKPAFKGRKFAADIRPTEIAALVPAWGLEKTLDFARMLAAQQPIWVRGSVRTFPSILAGEVPILIGPSFHSIKRVQQKDSTGVLQYALLEPVPVRLALAEAIQAGSKNPHAALLWLEWMASIEAQRFADEHEPVGSSIHVLGGAVKQAITGKKLSVVSWEHQQSMEQWQAKVFEAYGFPKAEDVK